MVQDVVEDEELDEDEDGAECEDNGLESRHSFSIEDHR